MEKTNDSVRDRLLARLPQPGNLAAYREETASLLARHEKALFWEKAPSTLLFVSAGALLIADWYCAHKISPVFNQSIWFGVGLLYFVGIATGLSYRINRSKVDLLKEIKQLQLQVLELQATVEKPGKAE